MSSSTIFAEPIPLLQTKLYRPQISPELIQRSHLIEQLNQGAKRKLTLIAAPAGYGKTTIVTQWLAQRQVPSAWLSLDKSDNDLILFGQYLVAAIRRLYPDSCANSLAALHNPQPLPWSQLIILFINDLVALSQPLSLVLDDYHFIEEEEIHQFLDRLLEHLPPLLHLIIISRTEPPLSLPRLRVRRQVSELRTADLCFSRTETKQYLTPTNGNPLAPETVTALQEMSEGWIAGLYLAKLSFSHNRSEQALLKQFQNSNTYILDFLLTEVLAQQPVAVQTFLLHTAILPRFCRPLCEALLENVQLEMTEAESQLLDNRQAPIPGIIDWLARHYLFTIALDDSGDWYRYHHLFQVVLTHSLQKQMRASQIARLHQKASRWFAQEGLIDEALHHAVAAEDMAFAAQLVEQHRLTLLNQFDYHTLERWLSRLPESVIDQRPQLLLLQCWLAILTYRLTSAYVLQRTQRVEAQLENGKLALDAQERTVLRAEIAAIKSFNHGANYNFQQGIIDFRQAIVALPFSHRFMRVHIILAAALGYQAQGERAEAIRIIETELRQVETASLSLPLVWLKGYLTVIYYGAGQLRQGVQTAEAIIKQLEDQSEQWAFARGVAYRWLGTIHYEWNQLTTAERFLRKVNMSSSLTYHTGQLNLAWLYEVTGQADKANEAVDNLHRWASSLTSNQIHNSLASFQARRLCWQGKVEQAREAMRQVEIPTYVDSFMPETPPLTLAQILIAHNQESSWEEAETLVDRLWTHVAKAHNIPGQIEVLALKALLQQRQERPKKALATLERAIELAEPGGFIRAFADLGTPIATLLYQLLKQGVAPDYLGQILAAFPQTEAKQTAVSPRAEATQTQLIEPLTRREIDVLRLLGKELSNKAIAQQLSISPLTVKRHTINIYQKLSVSSRQEAVGVAQTLGILARKA